ncbi:uncharacterized protein KY384_008818 [Bacidia gigantensis]|uniref:uncharacterized protein n=1 Tax=Bacidia gigantensis TaxID=2732470 RepID=UPI001D04F074|nr:uncharacterized protein KY384_008818 [Bacidia gigantensis]KAG8526617.1 hypothetical protein KY384_008818 [Bacidia gigantensis]
MRWSPFAWAIVVRLGLAAVPKRDQLTTSLPASNGFIRPSLGLDRSKNCSVNCQSDQLAMTNFHWLEATVTETIIAETIVTIINPQKNRSRCGSNVSSIVSPDLFSETALFLTETSTSTENDDDDDDTWTERTELQSNVPSSRSTEVFAAESPSIDIKPSESSITAPAVPAGTLATAVAAKTGGPNVQDNNPSSLVDIDTQALPDTVDDSSDSPSADSGIGKTADATTMSETVEPKKHSIDGNVDSAVEPGIGFLRTPDGPSAPAVSYSPSALVTFNGQTLTQLSPSQFILQAHTLDLPVATTLGSAPDSTPIAIQMKGNDLVFSVGSSSTEVPLNSVPTDTPLGFQFGTKALTPDKEGFIMIAGQTVKPGGSAIHAQGTSISLASDGSAVVIDGSTQSITRLGNPTAAAVAAFGDDLITSNSRGEYVVGGKTVAAGAPAIEVSGTPISLASDGKSIIVGDKTQTLLTPNEVATIMALKVGGQTVQQNSQGLYVVDGQTVNPGAPAISVSGTPISLDPAGSEAVVGGVTQTLSPMQTPSVSLKPLVFGDQTIRPDAQSRYVIKGQTLTPGGAVTVDDTIVSFAPNGSEVVVGTSTESLNNPSSSASSGRNGSSNPSGVIGTQPFVENSAAGKVSLEAFILVAIVMCRMIV